MPCVDSPSWNYRPYNRAMRGHCQANRARRLSRLCADFLREATPLIHWPQGLEPRNVDVFVHNEGWIDAPPEVIWANLIDAAQ
jgi:hypothetical protein